MDLFVTIAYYVFLLIHVASFIGALGIALKALTRGGEARGLWHAAASALIAGVALTALLSWHGEINETKIGIKLAISIAVLALSLLVARREKDMAEAEILASSPAHPVSETTVPVDPRLDDDEELPPVDTIRPLLIAVVIGVLANTALAILW